ncbi:MAG: ATP-binding protein [Nitrospirota bacterium]|jgi:two-component system sensor histidine kinase HydH
MQRKRLPIIVIVVITAFITYLHYSEAPGIRELHRIYTELYYIPVLIAAIAFGSRGAILTFVLVCALYLPYIFFSRVETVLTLTDQLLHLVLFGIFSVLAGLLVDRERKSSRQAERAEYLAGLGQAATTIVHELKNPLITILGFAGRIEKGKGNARESARVISESARTMQKIVSDVLDFARPATLSLEENDVSEAVRRACDFCRAKAEKRAVGLSLDLPAEPLTAMADHYRLERVFTNLIDNAVDASAQGQTVSVSARMEKGNVLARIKDSGPGIDREALQKIFTPFYTTKSAGTGLGMAIAKKVVDEHGGNIRIQSEPGKGTEVTVELPRKEGSP